MRRWLSAAEPEPWLRTGVSFEGECILKDLCEIHSGCVGPRGLLRLQLQVLHKIAVRLQLVWQLPWPRVAFCPRLQACGQVSHPPVAWRTGSASHSATGCVLSPNTCSARLQPSGTPSGVRAPGRVPFAWPSRCAPCILGALLTANGWTPGPCLSHPFAASWLLSTLCCALQAQQRQWKRKAAAVALVIGMVGSAMGHHGHLTYRMRFGGRMHV